MHGRRRLAGAYVGHRAGLQERAHRRCIGKIHDVLEELARSFIDNGYFTHEPLIATEEDDAFVVLEGNRRLAALLILHRVETAGDLDFIDIRAARKQLARLAKLPCYF